MIDDHCDCMWWVNTALWDLADVGSLIAPRPLMIASANQDGIFPITSIRRVHAQLQQAYPNARQSQQSPARRDAWRSLVPRTVAHGDLLVVPGAPDGQRGFARRCRRHRTRSRRLEQESTLKVYVTGIPAGNRAATIQDEFIALGAAPHITSATDLERARSETIEKLRHDTFNHFPRIAPKLELQEDTRSMEAQGAASPSLPKTDGGCTVFVGVRPTCRVRCLRSWC